MEIGLSKVLLMTDLTVPDPIRISLEFLGNSRVCAIGRDKFAVSTVMAAFTVNLPFISPAIGLFIMEFL